MFEHLIEKAFQQMADQEQPQSRVSIQQALRNGRARLRRRRLWRAAGTPALAAAAVLAIALPVSMSAGSHDATHQRAVVVPASPATSRHFSPLALYASFGWLPAKTGSNIFGYLGATYQDITDGGWDLRTYPVGGCELRGDHLECGWSKKRANNLCLVNAYIQARAPAVDGRPAYWAYNAGTKNIAVGRCLTWEYQPGGWAYLMAENRQPSTGVMVRVASAVRFGGHQPSVKFAAQLRNLPGRWQVVPFTYIIGTYGALRAMGYTITDGKTTLGIGLGFGSPEHNRCSRPNDGCRVINGFYVRVIEFPPMPRNGYPTSFQISDAAACIGRRSSRSCSPTGFVLQAPEPDADKIVVTIESPAAHGSVGHKYVGLMYTVFSHMKMLGTSPADWTTKPIR
jgi:hypothetical protein